MKKFEEAMTGEDKEKLYEAIGYSEEGLPPEMPIEYVDVLVKFLLKDLIFTVSDEELGGASVIVASLCNVSCNFSQRSSAGAIRYILIAFIFYLFGNIVLTT